MTTKENKILCFIENSTVELHRLKSVCSFIFLHGIMLYCFFCFLVQHWWNQPSRHLDRHWNPLQRVGHSGQRHLVRQEGALNDSWVAFCLLLFPFTVSAASDH